ncbi:MAG: permease [Candidatus Brocadiae bacterium]|nr:permease [Candidatus Brocadiia bacterium]
MYESIVQGLLVFWDTFAEMSPYLLFGFLVAGLLYVLLPASQVGKHLGGKGIMPVLKAAILGVPLPLCSCGVIPVAASFRKKGATRGAITAFLISTPQTGVDSIMITLSMLGPVFAVFRPLFAFISGLAGGFLVDAMVKEETEPLSEAEKSCCNNRKSNRFMEMLHYGFVSLPADIARPLLLGIIISSLIALLVPPEFFSGFWGKGIYGMLFMMLVAIPIYVCATGSVPIAAALIAKGISPGIAFVFLMTGPATNAATIATMIKTIGKKATFYYLATVIITALLGGLSLDYLFSIGNLPPITYCHDFLPQSIKTLCAFVLLGVFGYSLFPKKIFFKQGKTYFLFSIQGLKCQSCARKLEKALQDCQGIKKAMVDFDRREMKVFIEQDISKEYIIEKTLALGYMAQGRE